jgi:hypothetical protein
LPLLALALLSAAVLAHELLLTRLLAIVHWHHFVPMVVSMALLGYGIAGSGIAVSIDRLRPHAVPLFALCAVLFGLGAAGSFLIAQSLPFNALELFWNPRQLLWLGALYLVLTVPFVFGAAGAGLWLACLPQPVGRIYRADLLGAGVGAVLIVALLLLVPPMTALRVVAALGPLAGALALVRSARLPAALLAFSAGLLLALPSAAWPELRLSPFKGLSQALLVPGARVEHERSGPLGLLTVVGSAAIPFRQVPGLSLMNRQEPAAQLGLFVDGEGPTPITAFAGRREPLAYLDLTLAALPYHLLPRPRVLVLGLGGGGDVLLALVENAAFVDAVEADTNLVGLLRHELAAFTGSLLDRPQVRVHGDDARHFVAASEKRWDLLILPSLDAAGGRTSLHESFAHTIEAFQTYLDRLEPDGILAVPHGLRLPPRDSLKLFLTALTALERRGAAQPARHLALLRSWDAALLLVSNRPLSAADRAAIGAFAQARGFDLEWNAGPPPDGVEPFNRLTRPYFQEALPALVGPEREALVAAYPFAIRPASDDRPFFFDFFRWRALPELWAAARQGSAALLDWGYPLQLASTLQAALLSLVLVILPLRLRLRLRATAPLRRAVLAYFALIAVGFMFIEIGTIQRLMLVLGHPLHATAAALAGFLLFAGLGSGLAPFLADRLGGRAISFAVLAIGTAAMIHLLAAGAMTAWLAALPTALRIAAVLLLLAPLALAMGLPFPLALAQIRACDPALVPWAFGVNGSASVVAALLAALLATALGTRAVVALAIGLYGLAALVFRPAWRAAA